METFDFTVNKSFLESNGHPITVPKSQLPYKSLLSLNLDHENLIVILPQGERYKAEIYHGTAGYGQYFQIRLHGGNRSLPPYLKLDDHLIVVFVKAKFNSLAILEYSS